MIFKWKNIYAYVNICEITNDYLSGKDNENQPKENQTPHQSNSQINPLKRILSGLHYNLKHITPVKQSKKENDEFNSSLDYFQLCRALEQTTHFGENTTLSIIESHHNMYKPIILIYKNH